MRFDRSKSHDKSHPNFLLWKCSYRFNSNLHRFWKGSCTTLAIFMCDLHWHLCMKSHRGRQAAHEMVLTGGLEIAQSLSDFKAVFRVNRGLATGGLHRQSFPLCVPTPLTIGGCWPIDVHQQPADWGHICVLGQSMQNRVSPRNTQIKCILFARAFILKGNPNASC